MCDLKAYVKKQGGEDLVLEAVNSVRREGDEIVVRAGTKTARFRGVL